MEYVSEGFEICELQVGDEVFWHDPDDGRCSDYGFVQDLSIYPIVKIKLHSSLPGEYTEVLASELE
jgi:hypothetical protein